MKGLGVSRHLLVGVTSGTKIFRALANFNIIGPPISEILPTPLIAITKGQWQQSIRDILGFLKYRRNWLLSACAYSNGRQETMCLIKSMRLTASVRLIERTWALRAGPSTACVTKMSKIVTLWRV